MKAEEWALLDRQVLGVIRLTLFRSVAHNVVKEKTTANLMKALFGMYEKLSANNKKTMRMAVNNSTGKENLKYNDIRDLILAEVIRRRDAGETSGSGSALNLETRDRVDSPLDDWVLDSGASFHTTPHRETIQNYAASDFGKVYLAYGSALDVVGLGDVRIIVAQWVCLATREGYAILFVGGTWKVTKGARVLACGKKTNTLLGHMSEKGMKMLLSKGKLPELKSIDFDMCESCILGKRKKVSFLKTGRTPKAKKLELVHTDLWGPSSVASLGGSRYYITFIDGSSRNVWVYFLKNKSDVFETFKKWKAIVEIETCLKVECLRSDNGGEYIDGRFCEYCVAQGIRMEKTIPGTPQQNGVAERMNRTLNERARTLQDENSSKWELVMKDEMDSLLGNQTWELTELPIGKKALHNKWVYRIKNEHDGSSIEKINNLKKQLSKQFAMKDLGVARKSLAWKAALRGSQVDSKISEGFIRYMSLLHRCKFENCRGYVDADFAGDIDSRKKAEYVATTEVGKEMIWLHGFLNELGKKQEMAFYIVTVKVQFSCQKFGFSFKVEAYTNKIPLYFVTFVEDKLVILEKICGYKNPTDMLTKGVTIEKLKLCVASIGLLA
ncbi:Retrovirus-related Pol polyprotein from transposon TNT 1-94 [Vitis vinifera]|uniref:Retrovirus-related Pol polyprotein from transposon TNT 1-94 n=1 Tax=Vitis vinifera TaxID=29760 RepID=A0A438CM15_VITVI|nr:Retrovirus-related Pol polyprotein from transposon TNT 1-94 [Vitis vinifera]